MELHPYVERANTLRTLYSGAISVVMGGFLISNFATNNSAKVAYEQNNIAYLQQVSSFNFDSGRVDTCGYIPGSDLSAKYPNYNVKLAGMMITILAIFTLGIAELMMSLPSARLETPPANHEVFKKFRTAMLDPVKLACIAILQFIIGCNAIGGPRYDPLSIENTGIALVVASGVNTIFVFIYIHQQLSYRPSEQPSEPAEKEEAAGS